ncbi:hypothetical protein EVG20_g4701 [Dentipellis fragilis]|uniref:Formamidase n=1 Tax=Dentipellis fragilis TaxID=205917 RepID=A0A4Y9YVR2_9AGAM|nr:hypothetical protein EVG20_g4701 [Dentipellis fragilis]
MSIHAVLRAHNHLAWDNSIPPVVRIKSGDTVTFDCLDASNGQITPNCDVSVLRTLDFSRLDQVNGPVFVEGAEPGDTLQIDVLSIETADWGWSAALKGFGLLHDEFPDPAIKFWNLDRENGFAWFDQEKGIKVPLRPFCGEMGVAQAKKGPHSTIPPYHTGGNIDTRHMTVGSTLYLPVEVEGALFSCGDGHAAQGDGEVCGTAIETIVQAKFRFTVRKDKSYTKTPHFKTPPITIQGEEYYCTSGVDSDLKEATRSAVRNMIDFLCAEKGLSRVDAYFLCSVAGDLRMHEVVDMPNYLIGRHTFLPRPTSPMFPIVCLAITATPLSSLPRLLHILSWLWLHAFALSLSNQTLDLAEDIQNKPYRPIPAGRISYQAAYRLRWFLPLICLAWSSFYSSQLFFVSLTNCGLVLLYDELGGASSHWFYRNLLNAAGLANIEIGACLLAGDNVTMLRTTAIRAIVSSACVILFTIHAQDFKDVAGDAAVGRHTIPIVYPTIARPTFMILMAASSVALSIYWQLAKAAAAAFISLGSLVGFLFLADTSRAGDTLHLLFYIIWLSIAYILHAFSRRLVEAPSA